MASKELKWLLQSGPSILEGIMICTTYPAARFNEKRRLPVWGCRCPYTIKIHPLYWNVHTSEGAYQYHNGFGTWVWNNSFILKNAFLAYNNIFSYFWLAFWKQLNTFNMNEGVDYFFFICNIHELYFFNF